MRAVRFDHYGDVDVLMIADVPTPAPGAGEIRIRVAAAGVNPIDGKIRHGYMKEMMPLSFPAGSGMDAAGEVTAVGDEVTGVAVGDVVFGTGRETYAEEAVLTAWAAVPHGAEVESAASWGGVVETAVRVLNQLGIAAGSTLLVSGASGGVGTALLQIASSRGISVIGTASPANEAYVRGFGAEFLAYGADLAARVATLAPGGVQFAIDVAGSGIVPELIAITGNADAVLSIADFSAPAHGAQVSSAGPDSDPVSAFEEVCRIPGFSIPVAAVFSLEEAGEAQSRIAAGHIAGKVVLHP